jgi:hypothetical protein
MKGAPWNPEQAADAEADGAQAQVTCNSCRGVNEQLRFMCQRIEPSVSSATQAKRGAGAGDPRPREA